MIILSASGKKVLLSVHIVLVATWIGCIIAMLLLQVSRKTLFTRDQLHIVDKAIFILFDSVVMNVSIVVALTGLLFSMFTSWGFFRFRQRIKEMYIFRHLLKKQYEN